MDNPQPRRVRLFWPLVFILGGLLLLFQNLGWLPPGTWDALLQLWPVGLILLGLEMLFGRRSLFGSLVVIVLGALIISGALTWAALRANQLPASTTRNVIQSFREAEAANVTLNFKTGELSVTALGPSDYLMEGTITSAPGENVQQLYTVENGVGQLTLEQEPSALLVPFITGRETASSWAIRLSAQTPLSLTANTGAGKTTLDLNDLQLTHLTLNTGVGQASVAFPTTGQMRVTLNAGVGEVTLTLPPNLPVRLEVDGGLTNLTLPAQFASQGNVYTTANFSTAGDYLEIDLNAGVGKITIK